MTELSVVPLGQVISDTYSFALRMVGLAVFVMLLWAGLQFIIPGQANPKGKAFLIIRDAVIGTVILFATYLILNTINPDLVQLRSAPGTLNNSLINTQNTQSSTTTLPTSDSIINIQNSITNSPAESNQNSITNNP